MRIDASPCERPLVRPRAVRKKGASFQRKAQRYATSHVMFLAFREWTKMAEIFGFEARLGMPLSAFINMFKAEVSDF